MMGSKGRIVIMSGDLDELWHLYKSMRLGYMNYSFGVPYYRPNVTPRSRSYCQISTKVSVLVI